MKLTNILIKNFRSLRQVRIKDTEMALIFVGRNNTGKSSIIDALRAALGAYSVRSTDFGEDDGNIEISLCIEFTDEELAIFCERGIVSKYRKMDKWKEDFCRKLPSFNDNELSFCYIANREGTFRYFDGFRKHNPYIEKVLPRIYSIDSERNVENLQRDMLMLKEDRIISRMRSGVCVFSEAKKCDHCFSCIGLINQKKPVELDAFEVSKLLDYKLYQLNLQDFSDKVNENFHKNGGQDDIVYSMNRNIEKMLEVTTETCKPDLKIRRSISDMSKGMRSLYILSLLETYTQMDEWMPSILLMEEPELFLHPQMQKEAGEILYRLSRKNQVIFSTHSPNLLANFTNREIRQVVLDPEMGPMINEETDISVILDDLGYTANDLMNVNFVFIVEGKQDKSRLPLLLKRYYSEIYDKDGKLSRVAIITTNSCTNIETYANLKYMNQVYLKDSFLMIRDGDGRDRKQLVRQLCRYYEEAGKKDVDNLPRVTQENVVVLKYYSFENYFMNPEIMAKIGILESEEEFYELFYQRWRSYFSQISSGRRLKAAIGRDIKSPQDVKNHMEDIKIHLRGHNLFDFFYGRVKKRENEVLEEYLELAPREDFADILDAIDRFVYFQSRKKEKQEGKTSE